MPKTIKPPPIVLISAERSAAGAYHATKHSETLAGRIVLTTGVEDRDTHQPGYAEPESYHQLAALDTAKLLMADELVIVNPEGRIGDDAEALAALAQTLHKPVRYTFTAGRQLPLLNGRKGYQARSTSDPVAEAPP